MAQFGPQVAVAAVALPRTTQDAPVNSLSSPNTGSGQDVGRRRLAKLINQLKYLTSEPSGTQSCSQTLSPSKYNSKFPFSGQKEIILLPFLSTACFISIG